MNKETPSITIKAIAAQNALFLTVLGSAGLLLSALLANFLWHDFRLPIVFVLLMSFVTLLIGLFKHFEPPISFDLSPEGMIYYHRYGQWQVSWDNVMIIDQPKVTEGLETKELSYIGIKLRDADALAKTVSRRMANHMLQEQRDLYYLGCQLDGIDLFDRQINVKPFKIASGEKIIGPIGAWLHRIEMLRRIYGYDLYIPLNACDRSPQAFIELLKQCKASSNNYLPDST
jgi:hypothetical protein